MDYTQFNEVENGISLLGMGNMRLPLRGQDPTDIDEDEAQQMIDYLVESGVNYFDTAYGYHGGQSERFIGRALRRYPRKNYVLATKMPMWNIQEEADIPRLFEEQLQRTGAGYFDFYLCHSMTSAYFSTLERTHLFDFLRKKRKRA